MQELITKETKDLEPLRDEDKASLDTLKKYAERNNFDLFSRQALDLLGGMSSFTHPISLLSEDSVSGFDGSSLKGFQSIDESDLMTVLLPETAIIDRTNGEPKLRILARIKDPVKNTWYNRDPIGIAIRSAAYLKQTGIADVAYFGPEAEFFIFDHVAFDVQPNSGMYNIDSREGIWNSGENGTPNSGYRPDHKSGYSPITPIDSLEDIRAQIIRECRFNSIEAETGHHEVATAGQGEIDVKYADLVTSAHELNWFKHLVKNIAVNRGKTATFMPKPILGDNGSGMHVHQSLWKNGKPLFAGDRYAGLSEQAMFYMGGIIKHASALCALTNPSVNSYKRLVPHCEAPINLVYSARNRSAAIRIPQYEPGNPEATRIEVRFPDPLACGYLAFPAMLLAGIDGIQRKLDPGKPFDGNVYEYKGELKTLPESLQESLKALDSDREFLKQGEVFTDEFIDAWITLKKEEIKTIQQVPTPAEFKMYYMG